MNIEQIKEVFDKYNLENAEIVALNEECTQLRVSFKDFVEPVFFKTNEIKLSIEFSFDMTQIPDIGMTKKAIVEALKYAFKKPSDLLSEIDYDRLALDIKAKRGAAQTGPFGI